MLIQTSLFVKSYSYDLYLKGSYKSPWLEYVKTVLNETGFNNIWTNQAFPNVSWLNEAVKLRLRDQFKQDWHRTVETMPKCITYKLVKDEWGIEKYLLELQRNLYMPVCR